MKERLSVMGSGLGIFFLLPLVLSFFLAGSGICSFQERIDVERCLPYLMALEVPTEMPEEAMKAQAVILRTNLRVRMEEGESLEELLGKTAKDLEGRKLLLNKVELKRLREAAETTRNQYLTWEGEPLRVPYHEVSAGATRSGGSAFDGGAYGYLESVESGWDKDAGGYLSSVEVSRSRLPKRLSVLKTDESGYVLQLEADGQIIPGEYFRREMGLPSSAFTLQERDGVMRILCKGRGHGLGLSQYGACAMAEEGSSYEEILAYYFPKLQLAC